MRGESIRVWALLAAALAIGMTLLVEVRDTASASALSVGSRGLLTARRYLEESGVEVTLLDRPLSEVETGEVLMLAFPWQRDPSRAERSGIQRHLLGGGALVLAYSGDGESRTEQDALEWLGLSWKRMRDEPPLGFFAWRAYASEEWSLSPAEGLEGPPLRFSALSHAPEAPIEARVLYEGPTGEPLVFDYSFWGGRVVVVPSEVFANARLLERGNADLLESLVFSLGTTWSIDEYHHGLSAPLTPEQQRPRFALDLFLLHLGILYGLVVWLLARAFGPVWSERPVVSGSTRTFLLGLGSLHDRLGHHRDAAELLVRRARELHPRIEIAEAGGARSGAELMELAGRVAREQAK